MTIIVSLILILLIALVLLLAGTIPLMARMLLRPPRMTDGKALYVLRRLTPYDLGLEYEPLSFPVRDEHTKQPLRIAAWWISQARAKGKCVVIIHGYADAKVGGIAWAPMWHQLGWNILAIDLRAHGESEGEYSTAGYWERHDVEQVIDQLRAERPEQTQTLALFGISLGAAVSAAVGARREDLAAVILECPFADFRNAIAAHARLMGLPSGFMQELGVRFAQWLSGARFADVRPADMMPRIACPVMVIQSGDDPFIWPDDFGALEAAMQARPPGRVTHYFRVPEAGHVVAMALDAPAYRQRIADFLAAAGVTASPSPAETHR